MNLSTAENAAKEAFEESGYRVEPKKLAAVWDRARQGHPAGVFSCLKVFFLCDLVGGKPSTGHETSEVGWFAEREVPADLSLSRVLPRQVARMFDHQHDPSLPTDFE